MNKEEKLKKIIELEYELKLIEPEKKVMEGKKDKIDLYVENNNNKETKNTKDNDSLLNKKFTINNYNISYKNIIIFTLAIFIVYSVTISWWAFLMFVLAISPILPKLKSEKITQVEYDEGSTIYGVLVFSIIGILILLNSIGNISDNTFTEIEQAVEVKKEEITQEETVLPRFTLITNVDDIKNSDKVDQVLEFKFDVYDKVTVGEKKDEKEIKAEDGIFKYLIKLDEANKDYKFTIRAYNKELISDNFVTVSRKKQDIPKYMLLTNVDKINSESTSIDQILEFTFLGYDRVTFDGKEIKSDNDKFSVPVKVEQPNLPYTYSIKAYNQVGRTDQFITLKRHISETEIVKAFSNSDDYDIYKDKFLKFSLELISKKQCVLQDFQNTSGWTRSTVNYPNGYTYFTYCGGLNISNRIYFDAYNDRQMPWVP